MGPLLKQASQGAAVIFEFGDLFKNYRKFLPTLIETMGYHLDFKKILLSFDLNLIHSG